ncbi:MAG TPA: class I SAM-dependent methyltransferase [Pyrinomonadaceae bacterium]|nr:class I SAM-dependent methyltransferase [Pyrinomonadaceae bacterium]
MTEIDESPFASMDRMYRYQRYFYDLTRKFYLLGRDRLISEMRIEPDDRVLELGCGTARNLIILAKKHPQAKFFGLDASTEMLKTARAKSEAAGLANVEFRTALADEFKFGEFGLNEPFDACFFSYAVSIIPPWRESIVNALANLKPGKSLYIVDFYDQTNLPGWFGRLLRGWLNKFHVRYPEELIPFLNRLPDVEVRVEPLFRRYSLLIEVKRKD